MNLQKGGNSPARWRQAGRMKPTPEQLSRVEALKQMLRLPLTAEDMAVYNSERAAEMARAEARRQPTPQLPLEAAA